MTGFRDIDNPLDPFDREVLGLTRRHVQVLGLDAFRREPERPSDPHTAGRTPPEARPQRATSSASPARRDGTESTSSSSD
jgi:hypothetical protein